MNPDNSFNRVPVSKVKEGILAHSMPFFYIGF